MSFYRGVKAVKPVSAAHHLMCLSIELPGNHFGKRKLVSCTYLVPARLVSRAG